jgi:hypothetical protein
MPSIPKQGSVLPGSSNQLCCHRGLARVPAAHLPLSKFDDQLDRDAGRCRINSLGAGEPRWNRTINPQIKSRSRRAKWLKNPTILTGRFAECGNARHRAAIQAQPEQPRSSVGVRCGAERGVSMTDHVNFWNARNNVRNGNRCGDPSRAPRCCARARTHGNQPCLAPAVRGSARCRMHGGLSTGRTPAMVAAHLKQSRRPGADYSRRSGARKAGRRVRAKIPPFPTAAS